MVKIKDLLNEYKENLLEPIMVLSKLMDVDKSYIYTYIDKDLDYGIVEEFNKIMEKRKLGEPIQYLLGEKNFMGLNFYVDRGVLVPRNDTETLVEYLIDYIGDKDYRVLDLGLGSGAIGLSLAYYCKNIELVGVDISRDALYIARKNIEKFKLNNVIIREGNLFEPLGDEVFDIIVSNPPYIPKLEILRLDKQVKDFEPLLALDGGEDGLKFYREISFGAGRHLKKGGLIIYEVGYNQAEDVEKILIENEFIKTGKIKDIQGIDRVVLGYKEMC